MLFLELGQKELILVVIQEKKKKNEKKSMHVFICVLGEGRATIGINPFVPRKVLKLASDEQDVDGDAVGETQAEKMQRQNAPPRLHSSVRDLATLRLALALCRGWACYHTAFFLPISQIKLRPQEAEVPHAVDGRL